MISVHIQQAHDEAIASGVVGWAVIQDGVVSLKELEIDPFWECDPLTGNWHRRTPEFYAARALAEDALPGQVEAAEVALGVAWLGLTLPEQMDGPPIMIAPNGLTYEVIASYDAGEDTTHQTSGEAIRAWRERLMAYAASHEGDTLWWRQRPEIKARIRFGDTTPSWFVYCRLMIGTA